jgi:alpha-galactosidase
MSGSYERIAEVPVDPRVARLYEHGWQSWSPATVYPITATSYRPTKPHLQTMCWRPGRPQPSYGFQGEGLLAVDRGGGDIRIFVARDGLTQVPSIRGELVDGVLVVTTDQPDGTDKLVIDGSLDDALARCAGQLATRAGVPQLRPAPTVWCSWYCYGGSVTEADVIDNLDAISRLDLPIDVIQIDDGWQADIGDWLTASDRFPSLARLVQRVRDAGRRTGIWIAPFVVGARSRVAREHPDWMVAGVDAGWNWDQPLRALDPTHPRAADHLREAVAKLRDLGVDYLKLDFLYAGAAAGLDAYRAGLRLIRDVAGPATYILGSGAPILPSVGLVDAMRVSPDINAAEEPPGGDMSRPSLHAAAAAAIGRAWQHGRFWINDADCLLARPEVPHRERWAIIVERYGGLRASGDRVLDLDDWGIETTRRLLGTVPPPEPFDLPECRRPEGPPAGLLGCRRSPSSWLA